jgi:prepilin-type N-terminal cleavage/methylation domain-containing protein
MISTARHRRGFTLLELMLVAGLMAFLAVLLSETWAGIGKSTIDLIARSQLSQEIDVAVASLGRDLGGSLALPDSVPDSRSELLGPKAKWRLIDWRMNSVTACLELDFDGNPDDDAKWKSVDRVVAYRWDQESRSLIRTDGLLDASVPDTTFVVARNVDDFSFNMPDDRTLCIALTFGCYYRWDDQRTRPLVKRTCTLTANKQ